MIFSLTDENTSKAAIDMLTTNATSLVMNVSDLLVATDRALSAQNSKYFKESLQG